MFTPPYRLAGIALAFAVALAVSASATAAGDRFPPPPEGEGWKTLAGDGSVVTSDCIGEMSSPECIVDTMIACDAWTPGRPWLYDYVDESWIGRQHPVCDVLRIRPGHGGYAPRTLGVGTIGTQAKHRIYFYRTIPFEITEEMIPWFSADREDPDDPLNWRAGDVAVALPTVRCLPKPECRTKEWRYEEPTHYRAGCPLDDCEDIVPGDGVLAAIVRKEGTGWTIVEAFSPHRDATWPYLEAFYRRIR